MLRWRILNIVWSTAAAAILVGLHVHERIWSRIEVIARQQMLQRYLTIPAFLAIYFACWAILCAPLCVIRKPRDIQSWLDATIQQGLMFTIGGSLLMMCQILSPTNWQSAWGIVLLILVLSTKYFTTDLSPVPHRNGVAIAFVAAFSSWLCMLVALRVAMHRVAANQIGSPLAIAYCSLWLNAFVGAATIGASFIRDSLGDRVLQSASWSGGLLSRFVVC